MSGLVSAFLQSYHKYEKFIPLCVDFWLSPYMLVVGLNRGHGVEKFELDFDPTENTHPSHAKATTHGKRAPG